MFKSSEFVEYVNSMVGMPYWYGTCGYKCSESLLTSKAKQYPSHYSNARMPKYRDAIKKKLVCTDCVGLIKSFFWTNGGQGVLDYINGTGDFTNKYKSNDCPDKSANGMLSWCKQQGAKFGKIATLPDVPGVLVFSPAHVGVYVGDGRVTEARGFNYGVVQTEVDKRPWVDWAYLPSFLLQYDGEPEIVVPENMITITGSSVNIRKGPGTSYGTLKVAKKGEKFEKVDTSGWAPIVINGAIYWVSEKYSD